MASESTFDLSGLRNLTHVDWNNKHHRSCVVASLVNGVYKLEHYHQGSEALDPSWWKFFGFQLLHLLLVDKDGFVQKSKEKKCKDDSLYGAVFEYNSTSITTNTTPRYVIAFRGTLLTECSLGPDLKLGFKLLVNKLELDHRFLRAKEAVEGIISEFKNSKVWLAGHSLGSAIALLVGKKLISTMGPIETYLFNPPFPSTHVEWIKKERLKQVIRNLKSVATAGVAIVTRQTHPSDSFSQLDSWMPYLFVNSSDIICSGYIGYFEQRHHVEWISRLAPHHTLRSLFSSSNSEPFHVLPSAILTINNSPSTGFIDAHKLQQWWRPDNRNYESKSYRFSDL